ncbi:MAG: hemerythrin domain-containing protein [Proteobacteria bacterium]|nr:hemerythrin domain-containing protein [Pseudomonadota bacterium]HQR03465.1 hemerythrin domain-containing protein [Rhodocyclaceae bacterium]
MVNLGERSLLPSAPGLDEPVEMLEACHGRIEAQLRTLERLLPHLAENGADVQSIQACRAVMRYFDIAGRFHHEDEEVNLFPLLMERRQDSATLQLCSELEADHARLNALWLALREQLDKIAGGGSAALDADLVSRFSQGYREHIARENTEVLPLAQRLLTAADIKALSLAMSGRRGVVLP